MSDAVALTVTDQQTVGHVFEPTTKVEGGYLYETLTDPLVGRMKMALQLLRPRGPGGTQRNYRARIRLELPFVKQTAGGTPSGYVAAPEVSHRLVASLEITIPVESVKQERQNLHAMFSDIASKAVAHALTEDLETVN